MISTREQAIVTLASEIRVLASRVVTATIGRNNVEAERYMSEIEDRVRKLRTHVQEGA